MVPRLVEGQHLRVYPCLRYLAPEPELVRAFHRRRVVVDEVLVVVERDHRWKAGIATRRQVEDAFHAQRVLVDAPERGSLLRKPIHDLVGETLARRGEERPALVVVTLAAQVAATEDVDL